MISFIESKQPGQGHLSTLFAAIESYGLKVAVPTPLGQMEKILRRKGFVPHIEHDPQMGPVEVWMKPQNANGPGVMTEAAKQVN